MYENRNCLTCDSEFHIEEADFKNLKVVSPSINGKKIPLPFPTLCPPCRQQRRISFRNDQHFYRNECMLCKKPKISIYSEDKPIQVICDDCFWGDNWDPLEYGRDFNFNMTFFEQYADLRKITPRIVNFHTRSENSEYTVHASRNRNCYMSSSLQDCEDVSYSDFTFATKDSLDLFACNNMELCYQCVHSRECFNSDYLELCNNVNDSYLCFDCRGSNQLVACVFIRNGSNMILNEQASREECLSTIERLKTDRCFRNDFCKRYQALKLKYPRRDTWTLNTENSNGNYLFDTKNVDKGYLVRRSEDARYIYESSRCKDCYDLTRTADGELCYETSGTVDLSYSAFCNLTYQSSNLLYCDNCQGGTNNCFGSMSLKKHSYCILNKQYKKDEYFTLVEKIIAHMQESKEWGEFFPVQLSPFGYNETKAYDWYPLEKEEVVNRGWKWSDYISPENKNLELLQADSLPEKISEVSDDVTKQAIVCEVSGKPFRITSSELLFYRKKNLPLPSKATNIRHRERVLEHNQKKLYDRFCEKCGSNIQTVYTPERADIVYCEACYLEEAY